MKTLTLAIVIPVYNEQHHLGKCLDAIAKQTEKPDEVIVVDNNSTDRSVEIAQSYEFVRVIKEPKQGRAHARGAGFDSATADIIGRIDADSVITADWVEKVRDNFENTTADGLTGLGRTNLILGFDNLYVTFWSRVYFWATHSYLGAVTMWGANMAIRRSAWLNVRGAVCLDDSLMHEDQEMSLVMLTKGHAIIQDNSLKITTKGKTYLYWPKFKEYVARTANTKKMHLTDFTQDNPLRIGKLQALPGAIIGWFFTIIFAVYSLATWPITAWLVRKNKLS